VYGPLIGSVEEMRGRLRFFHWPLEFPEAFAAGGFDCLLGNPPWERLKFQDAEFFSTRKQEIAAASTASKRKILIVALGQSPVGSPDQAIYLDYLGNRRIAEAASLFCRHSSRYELSSVGDFNMYALFTELCLKLLFSTGFCGIIIPSGIATESATSDLFGYMSKNSLVSSFFDFENRGGFFQGLHTKHKFAALTFSKEPVSALNLCFFASSITDLQDSRKLMTLSADEVRAFNPNTNTLPIIRSQVDLQLLRKIYSR
jgi:hypothetical protein